MQIHGLILGAPFGNYIKAHNATRTLGTFTLAKRPGRLMQILKTVRYCWTLDSWVNKIGLRNPGFGSLQSTSDLSDKIVSIHGFNTAEWMEFLLVRIPDLHTISILPTFELNMSCPNVQDEPLEYQNIFTTAASTLADPIVKLPPVNWHQIFYAALNAGIKRFHCCNTLPTHRGGLSGAPLKMYSLNVIKEIRKFHSCDKLFLIGGGGVSTKDHISEYRDAGANRVAIASALFNPLTHFRLQALADFANLVFETH